MARKLQKRAWLNQTRCVYLIAQTLKPDPKKHWETLKNFDYPKKERVSALSQWFFYLFYPLRLLILGLIRIHMTL